MKSVNRQIIDNGRTDAISKEIEKTDVYDLEIFSIYGDSDIDLA